MTIPDELVFNDVAFNKACINGNLDLAKTYASTGKVNFDMGLQFACMMNHLEIAKWCYSQLVSVHALEQSLIYAYIQCNFEIANWCVLQKPAILTNVFRNAREDENLDFAEWCILKIKETGVVFDTEDALEYACEQNMLELIKLLKSEYPELEKCCETHGEFFDN